VQQKVQKECKLRTTQMKATASALLHNVYMFFFLALLFNVRSAFFAFFCVNGILSAFCFHWRNKRWIA